MRFICKIHVQYLHFSCGNADAIRGRWSIGKRRVWVERLNILLFNDMCEEKNI